MRSCGKLLLAGLLFQHCDSREFLCIAAPICSEDQENLCLFFRPTNEALIKATVVMVVQKAIKVTTKGQKSGCIRNVSINKTNMSLMMLIAV